MLYRKKRVPKPELVVNIQQGVYAWKCETKIFKVYGNSKQEAIDNFKKCIDQEVYGGW